MGDIAILGTEWLEIIPCKASTVWRCAMPDRAPARRQSTLFFLRYIRRAAPVFRDTDVDMTSTSTVHKRPELTGTLAVTSVAHRTVNEFHAHGGTAITLNLVYVRLTPVVRGTGARSGGGRVIRKIGTDVRVVGGGPAGTAFALVLAACMDNVVVLERGADFGFSFRGESLSLDTVWLPRRPGVLDQLCEQQIDRIARTGSAQDGELLPRVNFAACDPVRPAVEVSQPMLLRTLADAAVVHPHFMLVRSAGATDLLRSGGKVTGVSARTPDGEIEVQARLTVGADGWYSNVLGRSGLAVRKLPMNRDALYSQVNAPAPEPAAAEHGKSWPDTAIVEGVPLAPTASHALRRPDSCVALDQARSAFQQIRAPQVARSRGPRPRQEKMVSWSASRARVMRRTSYQAVERRPGPKTPYPAGSVLHPLATGRIGPANREVHLGVKCARSAPRSPSPPRRQRCGG
jgi:2-polyprenyl-6-methoxyphenol hydroxylase-like FAD-dependent oxidoreductase